MPEKIGIVTFHNAFNFGAALQAYALQQFLDSCGIENEIVDYQCDYIEKHYKKLIKIVKGSELKSFVGSLLSYRNNKKGIELSDSFSWDTHKWLMQIYSCSTLIVKDKKHLLNSFTEHPEYLADVSSSEHNDSWDLGPEMSRPARAIKLWYTLQATGTDLLAELIEYSFYNANLVKRELNRRPNWEIVSNPCCGTINFRYVPEGLSGEALDELTARISKEIINSGFAFIVTTTLMGKKTLRMCTINANTTEEDIMRTIALLDEIAARETAVLRQQAPQSGR